MPLTIAAWNVNSINARLPTVLETLKAIDADIICLQELKCEDAKVPREALEDAGYAVESHGQKTYNGVAILSRHRFEEVSRGLPGDEGDEQARYLEAVIATPSGPVRVASLYCPNGNPLGTEKFSYKLAWMARLEAHARALLALEEPLILAGDYNIIPRDEDCHDAHLHSTWNGLPAHEICSSAGSRCHGAFAFIS
jgi:exodeoxyribonuclease-3